MSNKTSVIIAAAGTGKRMHSPKCKQLLELNSKPVIHYSIAVFEACSLIDEIIIVTNELILDEVKELSSKFHYKKVSNILIGGKERQDSILNGLNYLKNEPPEIILIHDAVRPFITIPFVEELINSGKKHACAVPCIKLKDTIKITNDGIHFETTADRNMFRLIQTPQAFNFKLLMEAYRKAGENNFYGTDDASLVENLGVKPFIVEGSENNIKITTHYDLVIAEILINNIKAL